MSRLSMDEVLDAVGEHTLNKEGYARACCPAHDDRTPSLSIWRDKKGVRLKCHAGCSQQEIFRAVRKLLKSQANTGRRRATKHVVAIYRYYRADGSLNFEVVRYAGKSFLQRQRNASGELVWNMNGVTRTLYLLPRLLKADPAEPRFASEGEKDADKLTSIGLVATTSSGGAGQWNLTDATPLHGRDVVIIPDNDEAGRKHAQQVAQSLHGQASRIRILDLPGLEEGGDVSDWLDAGGTAEQLRHLADECSDYVPELLDESEESYTHVFDPSAPYDIVGVFVEDLFAADGIQTIRHFCGQFYKWLHNHYVVLEGAAMRKQLYAYLDEAGAIHGEDKILPFRPDKSRVDKVIDALAALIHLDAEYSPPFWIEEPPDSTNPKDLLVMRSGILNLDSLDVMDLTPKLFAVNALSFDYDPNSKEPTIWLNFLGQLWSDDVESIAVLQEWFGYCLTPDTRLQKMLLIVGPKRAGKGCIARVLTGILGSANIAAPTLSSFASDFGLQALIGKSLAIISDARLSGTRHSVDTIERLLNISGEDALTINRKYLDAITLKLSTRIMMLSNELPRLGDVSGALASRFIVLILKNSFYGREDPSLTEKLMKEVPGILHWAIEGRKRLLGRGRFEMAESASEAVQDLEDLGSPIRPFVREKCELGADHEVKIRDLYAAYEGHCHEIGRKYVEDRTVFGRNLGAAYPQIKRHHRHETGGRVWWYRGIGLRDQTAEEL